MATAIARLGRCCGAAAAVFALVTGCSTPGASLESTPEITLTKVAAPLHDPVWSHRTDELVASTDDHRVAAVTGAGDPAATKTRLSGPLASGRNLQISKRDEAHLLVPQPERGRVAVVDLAALRQVADFAAGVAPAYLTENAGLRVLLALSADGSAVTPVELYGYRALPTAQITGEPAEMIDGAARGRQIDYHLYGPSGIRYYKGPSSPPTERGSLRMDVAVTAGDRAKVTRTYVAGHHDGVLYAVDSRRGGQGLEVVGRAELSSSPIRYLGTDDTRVYAATDRQLVTLQTATFGGYPDDAIPVLRVTDYRAGLSGPAGSVPLSGMAIGPHRVYLTFAGQPYVASVAKPRL